MSDQISFFSATTTERDVGAAVQSLLKELAQEVEKPWTDGWFDLALVFLSAQFTYDARQIIQNLRSELKSRLMLGCTAEGVIGRDQELEGGTAISLVAAHLPGVNLSPFLLQPNEWHILLLDPDEFRRFVDAPADTRLFVVLGDPLSTPAEDVLDAFNSYYAGIPIVGGMASGALRPDGNVLFLDDRLTHEGIVGVALAGDLDVDVVVSQGCRPIWRPFKVTSALKNKIFSLEGRPPLAWIQELIPELIEEDRNLLQSGLYIGRAIRSREGVYGRGDFLIRGVMGIDRENGAIDVGDLVQEGEMIQFHIRDALTAREDLEMMLIPQMFREAPRGGLLFLCNGRGTRLYDYPNGDISIIQRSLEGTHLGGFFCAGEIGPIGGENFLHGQTASLALFRSLAEESSSF